MTLTPVDQSLAAHCAALQPDGLEIFTLAEGKLRGALLSATSMVARMRANHALGLLETLALGQAYVCAGLLSSTIKGEDRIAARLDCEGPLGGFQVEAGANGDVRGYLFRQGIRLDKPLESFDLAPFIQRGVISLTRRQEGRSEPFTGQCELSGRGIAGELSHYYLVSEQTNTAFFASVRFDKSGEVMGSGGLFLQALPGADPDALEWVEKVLASAPSLGTWFGECNTRRDFIIRNFLFSGIDFLGEKAARFNCPCRRERFFAYLKSMGPEELEKAVKAGKREREGKPGLEVLCHACGSVYFFPTEEIL